jgi:hypothetical protein
MHEIIQAYTSSHLLFIVTILFSLRVGSLGRWTQVLGGVLSESKGPEGGGDGGHGHVH